MNRNPSPTPADHNPHRAGVRVAQTVTAIKTHVHHTQQAVEVVSKRADDLHAGQLETGIASHQVRDASSNLAHQVHIARLAVRTLLNELRTV